MEELPGIDREAFDVLPLPLGVDRVEGQGTLARAAGARDDHEAIPRNVEVEILEIVDPRTANVNRLVRAHAGGLSLSREFNDAHALPSLLPRQYPKLVSLS